MKTYFLILAVIAFSSTTMVRAQGLLDKIERHLDKTSRTLDKNTERANKADKLGKKLGGLFGKKKSEDNKGEVSTVVVIENASYPEMNELNAKLKTAPGVQKTSLKYKDATSFFTIQHNESPEELITTLIKNSGGMITKDKITGVEDNRITIKMK
ncbi:hypothetical protein HX021_20585 [Sphingobacterium sp. N143]|uniref:hypothetical protein n=1 Tax=Sphingobacterium sp. N143 TaxID=2746727 RepID=UPI0025769BF0|nr:hypothetical protein [Sphingobacterium sp. N143]MDM1296687.1 hypothetical protein [Sphingobacterium sp. N143]